MEQMTCTNGLPTGRKCRRGSILFHGEDFRGELARRDVVRSFEAESRAVEPGESGGLRLTQGLPLGMNRRRADRPSRALSLEDEHIPVVGLVNPPGLELVGPIRLEERIDAFHVVRVVFALSRSLKIVGDQYPVGLELPNRHGRRLLIQLRQKFLLWHGLNPSTLGPAWSVMRYSPFGVSSQGPISRRTGPVVAVKDTDGSAARRSSWRCGPSPIPTSSSTIPLSSMHASATGFRPTEKNPTFAVETFDCTSMWASKSSR